MHTVVAMILAGGQGHRLSILAAHRAKPAVVFGGKYRIIDFTLTNCADSGITKIGVLTQYRPRSLNDHIGIGRAWDLDRTRGGVTLLQPYTGRAGSDWYKGTADAVFQNFNFIQSSGASQTLVLAGDHIYRMRYDDMIAFHRAKNADVTVGICQVPMAEASRYGIVTLDSDSSITRFAEKPARPESNLASMGIYVFNTRALVECLVRDEQAPGSDHDFGKNIVPAMLGKYRTYGYRFNGYWRDVGTIQSYWESNMEMLTEPPPIDLYDAENPVRTPSLERPPVRLGPRARVATSLLCHGGIINGEVRHSVLSPGVVVEEGASIVDSVVFNDTVIKQGAIVDRCVIDKEVVVGERCLIGYGDKNTPNHEEPDNLNTSLTIVGKGARIPPKVTVGRNCKVNSFAREMDFASSIVDSGSTIGIPESPLAPGPKVLWRPT